MQGSGASILFVLEDCLQSGRCLLIDRLFFCIRIDGKCDAEADRDKKHESKKKAQEISHGALIHIFKLYTSWEDGRDY